MFCGSGGNPSAFPDDGKGVAACYRNIMYLSFPLVIGILGVSWAYLQESKIRNMKTKFSVATVLCHMGVLDALRFVLYIITGFMPLVQWLVLNRYRDNVEFTMAVAFDTILLGILPWICIASVWLVYEMSRGSSEWSWLRWFTVVEFIGECLLFWSVCMNLDYDFPSKDPHSHDLRHWTVVCGTISLTLKFFCSFFTGCFNRDWRHFRVFMRSLSSSDLQDPLIHDASELSHDEESAEYVKREIPYCLERTPEQYAGLFSRILFAWMDPLMKLGYDRALNPTDMYRVMQDDESRVLGRAFVECFDDLQARSKDVGVSSPQVVPTSDLEDQPKTPPKGNLGLILKSLHNGGVLRPFYEAAFFKLIYDISMFVGPQVLKLIITFLKSPDEPEWKGYMYAGIMFATSAMQTAVLHIYFHRCFRTGMRVRTTLLTAIYRKSLRLTPAARQERTTGEIVNLMSTDCERLNSLFPYLHITWSSPLQVALSLYFLWKELQYSVLVSVAVIFFLMTPLTMLITRKVQRVQKELMKVKDERIRKTTEAISSMKVIKMYGWEETFRNFIHGARDSELKLLRRYVLWRAASRTAWTVTPTAVTLGTFASYVLLGNELTTEVAFTSLALLNILRFPLAMLPNIFNSSVEAAVSLRRISSFLDSEELDVKAIRDTSHPEACASGMAVVVKNGNFFWDDAMTKPALKDVNIRISQGTTTIITGEVGSGKTALLEMLIGELQPDTLSTDAPVVGICGTVAYASQVPWIQNATVRENILFGSAMDNDWYQRVITACSLISDFELLPDGDQTEIGERGINLSGGQKARVALARAVYSRADVLLLESCFEAVDEHVGTYLWKKCFMGILKETNPATGHAPTVMLVTHALGYARQADNVIVMRHGEVAEHGHFSDISSRPGSELSRLAVRLSQENTHSLSRSESSIETPEGTTETQTVQLKDKQSKAGNLTGVEERSVGSVQWSVYNQYLNANGGLLVMFSVLFAFLIRTCLDLGTNAWLSVWSKASSPPKEGTFRNLLGSVWDMESRFVIPDTEILTASGTHGVGYYLGIYAGLSVSNIVIASLVTVYLALTALKASKRMHVDLVNAVCRAPTSFFDTTPVGRILNRFSKDIYTVDESLPDSLYSFLSTGFSTVGTVMAISLVVPVFLAVVPFLAVMYRYVQNFYIASSRELKRLDSIMRSPIYSHFSESLDGVSTIRAYHADSRFLRRNQAQVDAQQGAYYISISSNRWLAVRMECIGTLLVFFTSLFVIMYRGSAIDYGLAGLAVSYALQVTQSLNWTVRMVCDLETNAVSIERLNEYTVLKPEAPEDAKDTSKIPPASTSWPTKGEIVFENVFARYRPELENVLKGLNLTITAGTKVGIVGRTGAGKSSLLLVLLRLMEPSAGRILIDGYDTRDFGLTRLRRNLAIIPQDPVMFSGSVRKNLDPMGLFGDDQLLKAIELVQLKSQLEEMRRKDTTRPSSILNLELSEGGLSFSFGQRQLLCIARAILRNCPIILLDEATSGVDGATDDAIQKTIRNEFKACTVLTIAHRLTTIMDGDKVAVMDAGKVAEYDSPKVLLNNKSSKFFDLVQKMNKNE